MPEFEWTADPSHRYTALLSKCIAGKHLKLGALLHSHFVKSGLTSNLFLANRILEFYSKSDSLQSTLKVFNDLPSCNVHSWNILIFAYSQVGFLRDAHHLLDKMSKPNVVTYNSLISGLTHHGYHREAIGFFNRVQKEFILAYMDQFTQVSVLNACAHLGVLQLVRQLHALAIALEIEFNTILSNAFIDAYSKCGRADISHSVFLQMPERDIVSWASMVAAYARSSRLKDAEMVFSQVPVKETVLWTCLIAGYVQNGHGDEALNLFYQMLRLRVKPNDMTFVSVLTACADKALLQKGKKIHAHIVRSSANAYLMNNFVSNALINMYSKCGNMKSAEVLFNQILEKDVVSWNSLITGFAQNSCPQEALGMFRKMVEAEAEPTRVTFLSVLSACSHAGLTSKGVQILNMMEGDHGMSPDWDHYVVLVDLLARKNGLDEAIEIIQNAFKSSENIAMWGAVLGASRVHGNLKVASRAAEALFELQPLNAARYVMLSNIYAAAERYNDSHQILKLMEKKGLRKEAACSWVEVRSTKHEFVANGNSCSQVTEVIQTLDNQMKANTW